MSRPFDSARYAKLLRGLDAIVLKSSELLVDNEPFRLDSEFHRKECRAAIDSVRAAGAEQFKDSSPKIIHPHEIVREYIEDGGVWFFRAQNLRPLAIDDANKVFVSRKDADALAQNRLTFGDILITRTGANRGDCAYFNSREEAVASSHTFIVRTENWNHAFLAAFFNSSYGKLQIDKGVYGAAQPEVAPYFLRQIWIPKISGKFQQAIARVFDIAAKDQDKALTLLKQAEETLLAALGLGNWQPPEPLTYTRTLSEVFDQRRIDAQFFAPRYSALRQFLHGRFAVRELGEIGSVLRGVTVPYYDDGRVPIIRSGDLVDISNDKRFLRTRSSEPIFDLHRGDVLISSIGFGSIGKVQVFDKTGRYGTVSEVTVVRQGEVNPHYLACFLRSPAGQMQLDRFITGATGQLHLYARDVTRVFVPVIPEEEQKQFQHLFEAAHVARARARELLDRAKRAVEIAIERDEKAALTSLEE